jgi:MFS family permease
VEEALDHSSYSDCQVALLPKGISDSISPYTRRWAAAVVMVIAALMDLIDGTIVNVALPTLQRDLHASGPQVEWTVSAYVLAFATTLITAGRLGDIVGRKRMFLGGTAAFGTASLLCAVAQSPGWLIGARTLQGVAAATIVPQVLATFRSSSWARSAARRSRSTARWAASPLRSA